jgi:DNA-binding transcriptional LysR family regulator
MPSDPGTPTLDQLRVFLTVVDMGSFAGAARRLGRATSVISYSIANLEAQLGVLLFDREATRKPQLTEAGRAVLSEARTITNGVSGLRAKVRGLLQGLEAEIHLVLDVLLPAVRVIDALKAFRVEFPTGSLRLYMEALGAVTQMVLNRTATIGICGPLDVEFPGLERIGVGSVELIPVAAPSVGACGLQRAGCWARPHPARADGPLPAHAGPGSWRDRDPDLALGRSRLEAHAAEGRHRLGLYARTDGARGSPSGAARSTRHARVQGRDHATARDLPDRHTARPGRVVAHCPVRGSGRSRSTRPASAPRAQEISKHEISHLDIAAMTANGTNPTGTSALVLARTGRSGMSAARPLSGGNPDIEATSRDDRG